MATLRLEMLGEILMSSCESCNWAALTVMASCCPCCGRRFTRVRLVLPSAETLAVSQVENSEEKC